MNKSQAATKEWNEKFGFFKITGLGHMYLAILAIAKSKADISKLHEMLPDNQRLFRGDLIKLEDFWYKHIKNSHFFEGSIRWLLGMLAEYEEYGLIGRPPDQKSNVRYYLDYVCSRRVEPKGRVWQNFRRHHLILSSAERRGHGYFHFSTSLIDSKDWAVFPLLLGCYLSKDQASLIVQLVTYSESLTERSAYLIGRLPDYVMISAVFGPKGQEVDLSYSLTAVGLKDKLSPYEDPDCPGSLYYMANSDFLEKLEFRLKEFGIPVGNISPIL
ncbi:MAG: hypothetical protein WC863_00060 [Patescibacteria group bacterium]